MDIPVSEGVSSNRKGGPKEVFLHLLLIVSLYVSAGAALMLLFQWVNMSFPDELVDGYWWKDSLRSIARGGLATLIIMFPVFFGTSWALSRVYRTSPSFREMKSRRWLLYFTLFAAALILAGDLVAVVRSFLEGEITTRFILKVCAVFVVAGSILSYYWLDLKKTRERVKWTIAYIGLIIVLVALIGGFSVSGSPFTERMRRFDSQRVNNLSDIQSYVVDYWENKGLLPDRLEDLNDNLRGVRVPVDPETKEAYGYEVKGEDSFSLCASFNLASEEEEADYRYYRGVRESTWEHDAGDVCFERTIDPDFFEPKKPPLRDPVMIEFPDVSGSGEGE